MSEPVPERDLQTCASASDQVATASEFVSGGQVSSQTNRHRPLLFFALTLAYATYFQTLEFVFVYDDGPQIVNSPFVKSWHFLPRYFSTHVWGWLPYVPPNYYRPLFLIWLRLNDALFDLRPFWWHLTTLALHLAVTSLVYLLAAKVTQDRITGAIAALIFGVHPAHSEVVAWVSGATESLLALFLILAFLYYRRSQEASPSRKARTFFAASLIFYVLALLTKETALVLPILILADAWLRQPPLPQTRFGIARFRTWLASAAPHFALTVLYLLVRGWALRGFYHPQNALPVVDVLLTVPRLFAWYLRHLIWPRGLSCFYDVSILQTPQLRGFVLPGLLLALLVGVSWWSWRKTRSMTLATGILWILVPLLPVLNFSVFFSQDIVHDRYLYVPSVGLSILLAAGLRRVGKAMEGMVATPVPSVVALVLVGLVLALGARSESQPWRENLPLFTRATQVAPNNPYAAANLAGLLAANGSLRKAEFQYQQVIRCHPDFWFGYYGLGQMDYRAHRSAEAVPLLERAAALTAYEPEPSYYLGLAQMDLGHLDEASIALQNALRLYPTGPGYKQSLDLVRKMQSNEKPSSLDFRAELVSHPDDSTTERGR